MQLLANSSVVSPVVEAALPRYPLRMGRSKREDARRVKAAFAAFTEAWAWLRKNPRRAMEKPRSTMDRVRRAAEEATRKAFVEEADIRAVLLAMYEAVPVGSGEEVVEKMTEALAKERGELGDSEIGASLLALYDLAEAHGPMSPMMVVCRPPQFEAVDMLTAVRELESRGSLRLERRAVAQFKAVAAVAGFYERHYLRMVWSLSFFSEGSWPSRRPGAFGSWVKQTGERLRSHPFLVDPEIAHFRNAVQHDDAHYLPASRKVFLRDQKAPGGWEVTLTLKELDDWLDGTWAAAYRLRQRLQSLATGEMLLKSGFFAAWADIRSALRDDLAAVAALEKRDLEGAMQRYLFRAEPTTESDLWCLSEPSAPEPAGASESPAT